MLDHSHAEYAGIREVQAVKDELLEAIDHAKTSASQELREMERRLSERIDKANTGHDHEHDLLRAEHEVMRTAATERHASIDSFIASARLAEAAASGMATGKQTVWMQLYTALRVVNEFRVLLLALVALVVILTGGVTVNVS